MNSALRLVGLLGNIGVFLFFIYSAVTSRLPDSSGEILLVVGLLILFVINIVVYLQQIGFKSSLLLTFWERKTIEQKIKLIEAQRHLQTLDNKSDAN